MTDIEKDLPTTELEAAAPHAPAEALGQELDPEGSLSPEGPAAVPADPVASTIASDTNAKVEKTAKPQIPEKASGVERLAEAGFEVPKIREYIPAEYFNPPPGHKYHPKLLEVANKIRDQFTLESNAYQLMIRSAHPDESKFPGGAFESSVFYVTRSSTVEAIAWELQMDRRRIVQVAEAKYNLAVRKTVRDGKAPGFKPEDMGIFINERVGGRFSDENAKYTVIPARDGTLLIMHPFFATEGLYRKNVLYGIARIKNGKIWSDIGLPGAVGLERIPAICEAAQKVFDKPQEMELVVTPDGTIFIVQSKTVEPPEPKAPVDDDLFEKGAKIHRTMKREGCCQVHYYRNHSESRRVSAIVIDEYEWLKEEGVFEEIKASGEFEGLAPKDDNYKDVIKSFYEQSPANTRRIDSILLSKYEELVEKAYEADDYILIVKTSLLAGKDSLIEKCRAHIMANASVQFRWPGYEGTGGYESYGRHAEFGIGGPTQIGIEHSIELDRFMGKCTSLNPVTFEPRDNSDLDPIIQQLVNAKDGDEFLVMMKSTTYEGNENHPGAIHNTSSILPISQATP